MISPFNAQPILAPYNLRVLSVESWVAVPAATLILGNMGAKITKVEDPGSGDRWRTTKVVPGIDDTFFEPVNWGKESIAIDLKNPGAAAVVQRLAAQADIFVTSYPQELREMFKITSRDMLSAHPGLIYVSFTAYGEESERANDLGFDYTAWAEAGLGDNTRDTMDVRPVRSAAAAGDMGSSGIIAAAALAAVLHREKTGQGVEVQVNLRHNSHWFNLINLTAHLRHPELDLRPVESRRTIKDAFRYTHRLGDDRDIIITGNSEKDQSAIFKALGISDEIASKPNLADYNLRRANAGELETVLATACAKIGLDEWKARAKAHNITWGLFRTQREAIDDLDLRRAGVVAPSPDGGEMITPPMRFVGSPGASLGLAPKIGQDTRQVLTRAGYRYEEIAGLIGAGVVSAPDYAHG